MSRAGSLQRAIEVRNAGKEARLAGLPRIPPAELDNNERSYWMLGWWDAERETEPAR